MAHRDRATVHLEALLRNSQSVGAVQHLHGEGLVELPQVNVLCSKVIARQELGYGEHRPNSHLLWMATRHCIGTEPTQGLQA